MCLQSYKVQDNYPNSLPVPVTKYKFYISRTKKLDTIKGPLDFPRRQKCRAGLLQMKVTILKTVAYF